MLLREFVCNQLYSYWLFSLLLMESINQSQSISVQHPIENHSEYRVIIALNQWGLNCNQPNEYTLPKHTESIHELRYQPIFIKFSEVNFTRTEMKKRPIFNLNWICLIQFLNYRNFYFTVLVFINYVAETNYINKSEVQSKQKVYYSTSSGTEKKEKISSWFLLNFLKGNHNMKFFHHDLATCFPWSALRIPVKFGLIESLEGLKKKVDQTFYIPMSILFWSYQLFWSRCRKEDTLSLFLSTNEKTNFQ